MTEARLHAILQNSRAQAVQLQRAGWQALVVCLFLAAMGIRMYQLSAPPLNFHATRQYRSLVIARGFFYASNPSIPQEQKQVALLSAQRQGILEPPIFEAIVAAGYRLAGRELPWLPHLLSSLFWLVGGIFLYQISRRLTKESDAQFSAIAALFSTAFYLFLPFAVQASRSFQPDPLMILLMLASLWSIQRYDQQPSTRKLGLASLLSSLAFLVKPGIVFVLLGAFIALSVHRRGFRGGIFNMKVGVYTLITVLPTLAVYAYGSLTGAFLIGEAEKTLLPNLYLTAFYWRGLMGNISEVVGYTAFLAALLGLLLLQPGAPRALLLGLWSGYAVFCLALNYNVATHNYYQLQLIPIAGLSLGPVVALVVQKALSISPHWAIRFGLAGIALLALAISLGSAAMRLAQPQAAKTVAVEEAIGEQVNHNPNNIYLSDDYGVSLEYHGLLSGKPWPLPSDLEWERLAGFAPVDAATRFHVDFAAASPRYFIVQDLAIYEQEPDLKEFLSSRYPLAAATDDYLIYDLQPGQK